MIFCKQIAALYMLYNALVKLPDFD